MPKMTPQGVMVKTVPEFFADEAKREGQGRCGGELMSEFFAEMENEMKKESAALKQPENALAQIRDAVRFVNRGIREDGDPNDLVPVPRKITKVLIGAYSFALRTSDTRLVALGVDIFGRDVCWLLTSWSCAGSYYDPPDGDTDVDFVILTGKKRR